MTSATARKSDVSAPAFEERIGAISKLLKWGEKDITFLPSSFRINFEALTHIRNAGAGASIDPKLQSAYEGHRRTCEHLLTKTLEAKDAQGCTPLLRAALTGNDKACKLLLAAGANRHAVNNEGASALHLAAFTGKNTVVQLFSRYKDMLDTKAVHFTPLMWAACEGHDDVCFTLLEAGADPLVLDNKERSAYVIAKKTKHYSTAEFLDYTQKIWISKKALEAKRSEDASHANSKGQNALHLAAKNGTAEDITKLLSSTNSLLESTDAKGLTPLLTAARAGNDKACALFLAAKANFKAKSKDEKNVLHFGAISGNPEVVKLFAKHRKMIEAKDAHGLTPLIWAAFKGHLAVCKLLLEAGASPSATDTYGRTALQIAEEAGKASVVELLKSSV